MKKQILALVCIATLFSACSRAVTTTPKLNTIYVKLEDLTDCNTTYIVSEDNNVTLPLDDAKCIVGKLETSLKDREKLHIANVALNAQIFLSNSVDTAW